VCQIGKHSAELCVAGPGHLLDIQEGGLGLYLDELTNAGAVGRI
jgi:hypothetical protein